MADQRPSRSDGAVATVEFVPRPIIRHAFPIGHRSLLPGDVAYCGYVKKLPDPAGPKVPVSATECVVCADVAKSRGHYG